MVDDVECDVRHREQIREAQIVILVGVADDSDVENPGLAEPPIPPVQEAIHAVVGASVDDDVLILWGHDEAAIALAHVDEDDFQKAFPLNVLISHPAVTASRADLSPLVMFAALQSKPITPQEVLDNTAIRLVVYERIAGPGEACRRWSGTLRHSALPGAAGALPLRQREPHHRQPPAIRAHRQPAHPRQRRIGKGRRRHPNSTWCPPVESVSLGHQERPVGHPRVVLLSRTRADQPFD